MIEKILERLPNGFWLVAMGLFLLLTALSVSGGIVAWVHLWGHDDALIELRQQTSENDYYIMDRITDLELEVWLCQNRITEIELSKLSVRDTLHFKREESNP